MRNELLFWKKGVEKIRKSFSSEPFLESLAFILTEKSSSLAHRRLIEEEIIIPEPKDYRKRSGTIVSPTKEFMTTIYKRCFSHQKNLIKIHSHVGSISPNFSSVDNENDLRSFFPYLMRKFKGLSVASVVTDTNFTKIDARLRAPDDKVAKPVDIVKVIGSEKMRIIFPSSSPLKTIAVDEDIYSRTILAFGQAAQRLFSSLVVAVIGVGGLGACLCKMLGRLPVHTLIMIDPDTVDLSNLNRLPGATRYDALNYIPKVECLKRYLWSVNPDLNVIAVQSDISEPKAQDIVKQADVLFGAVDRPGPRLIINRLGMSHAIPYFDCGAGIEVEDNTTKYIAGQVYKVIPGAGYCLSCLGSFSKWDAITDLLPEGRREALSRAGYVRGADEPNPAVYFLNMNVSSLAMKMMMDFCTIGCKPVKVYTDLRNFKLQAINIAVNEKITKCPICSSEGILGLGDAARIMTKIKEKVPEVFGTKRGEGNGNSGPNTNKSQT